MLFIYTHYSTFNSEIYLATTEHFLATSWPSVTICYQNALDSRPNCPVRCLEWFWCDLSREQDLVQCVLNHGLLVHLRQNIVESQAFEETFWFFAASIMRKSRQKIEMDLLIAAITTSIDRQRNILIHYDPHPDGDGDWTPFLQDICHSYEAHDLNLLVNEACEWIENGETIQANDRHALQALIDMLQ
eukprot:579123_1